MNTQNQPVYRCRCRVLYADTDKMGIAFHANYFRWFELGRAHMFRSLGMPYKSIEEKGYFLPITEIYCKFASPVRYDDELVIETRVDREFRPGIKFDYEIFVHSEDRLAARGSTTHVFLDTAGKLIRPPKSVVSILDASGSLPGKDAFQESL